MGHFSLPKTQRLREPTLAYFMAQVRFAYVQATKPKRNTFEQFAEKAKALAKAKVKTTVKTKAKKKPKTAGQIGLETRSSCQMDGGTNTPRGGATMTTTEEMEMVRNGRTPITIPNHRETDREARTEIGEA